MKRKKTVIIALAILSSAFILSGIFFWNRENDVKYRMERVTKGDIQAGITATGTVNAVTTVLVGTQVSVTLKEIHVDYNFLVKKGQLLALIDPATFDVQFDQAKANLFSAKANVEKSKAALLDAKRTFDRNKQLWAKNLIARSDHDTS